MNNFYAKEFIQTAEGLIFAIIQSGLEHEKVLCFLRYVQENQRWQKIDTERANAFLKQHYPCYLHYSPFLKAHCHAVEKAHIVQHFSPQKTLANLIKSRSDNKVILDLQAVCHVFKQHGVNLDFLGITGSILINAQNEKSDIDLVCYDKATFHFCRRLIENKKFSVLTSNDWQETYQRRDCDLTFNEYVWHEQRKFNKFLINQRKVDLNFLDKHEQIYQQNLTKLGNMTLTCKIIDDRKAFDYPAEFFIEHEKITKIVCFTATYLGQAKTGEIIEVSGSLEQNEQGIQQIIVGSTREARGEYIKVCQSTI